MAKVEVRGLTTQGKVAKVLYITQKVRVQSTRRVDYTTKSGQSAVYSTKSEAPVHTGGLTTQPKVAKVLYIAQKVRVPSTRPP